MTPKSASRAKVAGEAASGATSVPIAETRAGTRGERQFLLALGPSAVASPPTATLHGAPSSTPGRLRPPGFVGSLSPDCQHGSGRGMGCMIPRSRSFSSLYKDRKAQVEAKRYASDAAEGIERACGKLPPSGARKCIGEIITAQRESERGESDLAAQWEAAEWSKWAGVAALAQLLATVIGLYYIKGTLDETRRSSTVWTNDFKRWGEKQYNYDRKLRAPEDK